MCVYRFEFNFRNPSNFPSSHFLGVCLLPVQKRTWGPKGAKQVHVHGKDDKRQFTLVPFLTAAGTYAGPAQLIWAGSTTGCHLQNFEDPLLTQTHSLSHWSTEETIFQAVESIFQYKQEWCR